MFLQFEVTLGTRPESRRIDVLPMPEIGSLGQQRRSLPHRPRRTLVETDFQTDVQIRVIGTVDTCHFVGSYRIIDFPFGDPCNQILSRNTVCIYFVDVNTTSQFLVQILQAGPVFSTVHVDFLPHQFRHILQGSAPLPLYDNLMRNVFFTAINQTVLPMIRNSQVIGNQVSFSIQQHPDQLRLILGCLHFKFQSQ